MWTLEPPTASTDPRWTACGLCGRQTPMLGTARCNRCWELEKRIRSAPSIARRILSEIESSTNEARHEH